MPSVLRRMDSTPAQMPHQQTGTHAKYILAVIMLLSSLMVYLR